MLPVREVEKQLLEALRRDGQAVLTAPTGSGKTTQVPQILLQNSLTDGWIVVLQPRRLATRMVATRVAAELNSPIGSVVGYQTRHESKISPQTRIRFMTEGLFLRMLQTDPLIRRVGAVVLDEFHERNIAADIALGLTRRLRQTQRPDLKLLVMSATLDAEAVAGYLKCDTVRTGGRLYPIETRYLPRRSQLPCWDLAADALQNALAEHDGDVLFFMPGAYEIGRTIEACKRVAAGNERVQFFPLHGSLPVSQQDAAIAPCRDRKVIVATNVAETSITIEGVRCVIDSGLARIHRYDGERGINVLRVEPVSRASADQRAGRAGRTGPGLCLRLWTEADHHQVHEDHELPEVQRIELAEPLLQLRSMGVEDVSRFPWLDAPSPESVDRGEKLLRDLGAVDTTGKLAPMGKQMADFPTHPRISRMLLEAAELGCLKRAVRWAAIISERDIVTKNAGSRELQHWMDPAEPQSDLALRERALLEAESLRFDFRRCDELGLHANTCREVSQVVRQLENVCRRAELPMRDGTTEDLLRSLLAGYSDHVAMKLETQRPHCAMPGRKKVVLDKTSVVREAGLLVAVELHEIGRGNDSQTTLALASRVDPAWLDPAKLQTRFQPLWNDKSLAAEQVEEKVYGDLVIERTARPDADLNAAADMLAERIRAGELKLEGWDESVEQWIARTRCVADWFPEKKFLRYDEEDLRVILHEIVHGSTRFNQIKDKPCLDFVRNALEWEQQQFVEKMAPAQIKLPRGWGMKITYEPGSPPRGRGKIQDFYGLEETPKIAGGRQTILLEILAPNYRPIQVTQDLANFWKTLYPQMKNELRRRYPKQEWR